MASGRYPSGNAGAEKTHYLEVQEWPMQVKEVLTVAVVKARSSTNANVKVHLDEGPSPVTDQLTSLGDPIGAQQVNQALPVTLKGSVQQGYMPYIRPALVVKAHSGTTEEWVDIDLYMGGKPY